MLRSKFLTSTVTRLVSYSRAASQSTPKKHSVLYCLCNHPGEVVIKLQAVIADPAYEQAIPQADLYDDVRYR